MVALGEDLQFWLYVYVREKWDFLPNWILPIWFDFGWL
jgi:hypothetical protein